MVSPAAGRAISYFDDIDGSITDMPNEKEKFIYTPENIGHEVLSALSELCENNPPYKGCDFHDDVLGLIFHKESVEKGSAQGQEYLDEIGNIHSRTDPKGNPIPSSLMQDVISRTLMRAACAFSVQAIYGDKSNDTDWHNALAAQSCLGMVYGYLLRSEQGDTASAIARQGAIQKHAESKSAKADVFKWCKENLHKYKSMDAAAEDISKNGRNKLVPFSTRTVRGWIAEYNKLHSTGKA